MLYTVGGRTRYAFAVGVGGPGVPNLHETDDDGMGMNNLGFEGEGNMEDMVINALARRVRIAFDSGRNGVLPSAF